MTDQLIENIDVRQRSEEGIRQWFLNSFFDIILWYSEDRKNLKGFQFCYSRNYEEKAFTWTKDYRSNRLVSDTFFEKGVSHMSTGILTGEGGPIPEWVIQRFKEESGALGEELREFIVSQLENYNRSLFHPSHEKPPTLSANTWVAGREDLSLEMVEALARKECAVRLEDSPEWIKKIQASVDFLEALWTRGAGVYGVTTGVGDSVTTAIPASLVEEFPARLLAFHGCGLGKILGPEDARAVVAVRLANLVRGLSGVRPQVLELLVSLLKADLVPQIPEEGSVGASGDLTPLSYLAAVLTGERRVWFREESETARTALEKAGLAPLVLRPKEALAIMNGTAVMAALGARVWVRSRRLARLASLATALASRVLQGNPHHFDPGIFQAKPHKGTIRAGKIIQEALGSPPIAPHGGRLQDSYALRCAPHVLGVLFDTLEWTRPWLETEINGVSDNPLLDPTREGPLHGGNFYGGHVAMAMESLKNAAAQVADLLDRQVHLLLDPRTNRDLPANLSGSPDSAVHHGLKALGIAASAWAAEALKTSLPSSVFSRSTESHNQDKVSLGTLAAREGVRVLELTEQVLVASLVTGVQGAYLRGEVMPPALAELADQVRKYTPPVESDRALDTELRTLLASLGEIHHQLAVRFDFLDIQP